MIQVIGLIVLLFLPQYWTLPGNELPQNNSALPGEPQTLPESKFFNKLVEYKNDNQIEDERGQDDKKSEPTVLPNVTSALPNVTSALPNVTTALPNVTNNNRTEKSQNSNDLETAETFYKGGGGGGGGCCYQQPAYVQPVYVQPVRVQPVYVQPVYVQPVAQHRPQHRPQQQCCRGGNGGGKGGGGGGGFGFGFGFGFGGGGGGGGKKWGK